METLTDKNPVMVSDLALGLVTGMDLETEAGLSLGLSLVPVTALELAIEPETGTGFVQAATHGHRLSEQTAVCSTGSIFSL